MQGLRNVVKQGGNKVGKRSSDRNRELWIEPNIKSAVDSYFMGNQSLVRQRYNSARIRQVGRDLLQDCIGRDL